jgi:para-nitrobenzyl esterase
MRTALSSTYQGAELDRIIATFRRSRPGATPAQLYLAITTSPIWRDAMYIAEVKAAQHAALVFMYQLAYPDPRARHELSPRLNARLRHPDQFRQHPSDARPSQRATARHMSALWAGFARHSHPTAPGVPRWPAYTTRDRATMWIDANSRIVKDPDRSERLFWNNRA